MDKRSLAGISLLCILFNFADRLGAQGPPIFTDTPIMLGLEGRGLRTFGKFISKDKVSIYRHLIAVPYNISAKWQVGGIVPFASISPEGGQSRFGLSDVVVVMKYQLLQIDGKGKTFRSLIKLTESFPTGNTGKAPPLGAGVYQTMIGLVNGYVTTQFGIYGEVAYNFVFDGRPDELLYNLAIGVPLLPQKYPPRQVNLYLELTGNYLVANNSSQLYIAPGIQWINGRRFLMETGIQFPLKEQVPEGQQTNFMYTLGTRILIF